MWQWAGRTDGYWGRKVLEWRLCINKPSVDAQQDGPPTTRPGKATVRGGCKPLPTDATGDLLRSHAAEMTLMIF